MAHATREMPCQIYLVVPEDADVAIVGRLLASGRIASLLLLARDGSAPAREIARAMVPLAHGHGIPLVIAHDADIARYAGADGVHIPANEPLYASARSILGSEAIIGADCGASRHDALTLAELGADYVAFGMPPGGAPPADDITALVSWWAEVCEPPVVAWHNGGWDEAVELIAAGADFIAVSALVLEADDPEAALDRLDGLIAGQGAERRREC